MKSILAVTLAMMALVSVAMADGGGLPPVKGSTTPEKPAFVVLADGGGLPPVKGSTTPEKPAFVVLADGGGLPPTMA